MFCTIFNFQTRSSYYINNNGELEVRISVSDQALQKVNWDKGRIFTVEV